MIILNNGKEIEGSVLEVIDQMWDDHFHKDLFTNRIEYMERVTYDTWKFLSIGINIGQGTEEDKANNFLKEMIENSLIILIEGEV